MKDLIQRSGLTVSSVADNAVCQKLSEYRQIVGIPSSSLGILGPAEIASSAMAFADKHPILPTLSSAGSNRTQALPTDWLNENTTSGEHTIDPNAFVPENHIDDDYYQLEPQSLMHDYDHDDGSNYFEVDDAPQHLHQDNDNDDVHSELSAPSTAPFAEVTTTPVVPNKLEWTAPSSEETLRRAMNELENMKVSTINANSANSANDYAFFAVEDLVSDDNSWAGAKHWSYRTRSKQQQQQRQQQQQSQALDTISETSSLSGVELFPNTAPGKTTKKKVGSKKESSAGSFVLSLELVDEKKFPTASSSSSSKGRARVDTTRLTKQSLEKTRSAASTLLLPSDEQLKAHDLCRLFLLPSVVVPPRNVRALQGIHSRGVAGSNESAMNLKESNLHKAKLLVDSLQGDDLVWSLETDGLALVPKGTQSEDRSSLPPFTDTNATTAEGELPAVGPADFDNDFSGDYYGDDFEAPATYDSVEDHDTTHSVALSGLGATPVDTEASGLSGLEINRGNLIQANRVVEKIDINYAKTSKRVDVHKLKGDVWTNIQDHLGNAKPSRRQEIAQQSAPLPTEMSFQGLVHELADDKQQQKDVSLAYYFICLLHLANENSLKITGEESMADLTIQYDK